MERGKIIVVANQKGGVAKDQHGPKSVLRAGRDGQEGLGS